LSEPDHRLGEADVGPQLPYRCVGHGFMILSVCFPASISCSTCWPSLVVCCLKHWWSQNISHSALDAGAFNLLRVTFSWLHPIGNCLSETEKRCWMNWGNRA